MLGCAPVLVGFNACNRWGAPPPLPRVGASCARRPKGQPREKCVTPHERCPHWHHWHPWHSRHIHHRHINPLSAQSRPATHNPSEQQALLSSPIRMKTNRKRGVPITCQKMTIRTENNKVPKTEHECVRAKLQTSSWVHPRNPASCRPVIAPPLPRSSSSSGDPPPPRAPPYVSVVTGGTSCLCECGVCVTRIKSLLILTPLPPRSGPPRR